MPNPPKRIKKAAAKSSQPPAAPGKMIRPTAARKFEEMDMLGKGKGSSDYWQEVSRADKLRYCRELAERDGIEGRSKLSQAVPGAILEFLRADEKNWLDAGFERRMRGGGKKKRVPNDPLAEDDVLEGEDGNYDDNEVETGNRPDGRSVPPPGYPGGHESEIPEEYEEEDESPATRRRRKAVDDWVPIGHEEDSLDVMARRLVTWKHSTPDEKYALEERFFDPHTLRDIDALHRLLYRFGVPAGLKGDHGRTLLMSAIEERERPALEKLLEFDQDLEATDSRGDTAMHYAGNYGVVFDIGLLKEKGANLDAQNETKETALMLAAYEGHERAVEKLLELGANPTLENEDGKNAVHYAELGGHGDIARILCKACKSWSE